MAGKRDDELDVLEQFKHYVSADLGDGRSKSAIALKRIRNGLKADDNAALKEILVNVVSINLHIEKEMTDQLMQDGKLVDTDGNLIPAISKDLLKLRDNTLKYLKMLQSIQSKPGKKSSNSNLWDMIDE
jgi:hypothetical protein